MKTLLLAPILSLFPRRWRESTPSFTSINWPLAAALSGLIELFLSLQVFLYWYTYSVTGWAGNAVRSAVRAGADIPPGAEGFAALAVMFLHPLTWLLVFLGIEGTVRFLGAAFAGDVSGILPLYVLDKIFLRFMGSIPTGSSSETATSYSTFLGSLRQHLRFLRHPILPDEVLYTRDALDDVMSISASRPKSGWEPPRVVYCNDQYYRLELSSEQRGPRPYLYRLRRLPSGVPGRSVIIYSPEDPLIRGR